MTCMDLIRLPHHALQYYGTETWPLSILRSEQVAPANLMKWDLRSINVHESARM
jgi:hypothetical protein